MKRIALINDLSGFGKCSLTAAIPVISVMGMQACPLPTAILSAQTGFADFFCDDYTDKMDAIAEQWRRMDVDFAGIYSGYLADARQIRKVLRFLEQFRDENTLYLADPVMGDHGEFYAMFGEDFLQEMKALTGRADVITPNLTELCFLAAVDYKDLVTHCQDEDYIDRIKGICKGLLEQALVEQTIVVTGIAREKDGEAYVGNLAVSGTEEFHMETRYTGKGYSGTGDLFASVICGSLVKGLGLGEAMEKACGFLQEAIEEATRENIPTVHGVPFEKYLSRLM